MPSLGDARGWRFVATLISATTTRYNKQDLPDWLCNQRHSDSGCTLLPPSESWSCFWAPLCCSRSLFSSFCEQVKILNCCNMASATHSTRTADLINSATSLHSVRNAHTAPPRMPLSWLAKSCTNTPPSADTGHGRRNEGLS